MISNKKKYMGICLVFLSLWLLCGCFGKQKMTIDTTLTVNEDFKGSREMKGILPEAVFKQIFHGDMEELTDFLAELAPSTYRCEAKQGESGVEIVMTLDFISLEDYSNKVGQILKKTPGIYFDISDSVFKKGLVIQENFTSADLFVWLEEAFQNENLKDAFEFGTTMVHFEGRTFETGNPIEIKDMDSMTFDSISAEITMNEDASYKVAMNFMIDLDDYYSMGDTMDEIMKDLTPSGGVFEVSNIDKQRVYTIAFSAFNEKTLITQLNMVLKSKDCRFEVKDEGDTSDPFKAYKRIVIDLDGSYFLDFTKEETEMIYLLNVPPEYTVDHCESKTGYLKEHSYDSNGKNTSVLLHVGPCDEVQVGFAYGIDLTSMKIHTIIHNEHRYERRIECGFDLEQIKLIGDGFEKRLKGRMDEETTLEIEDTHDERLYVIRFEGDSVEALSRKTTAFLDGTLENVDEVYTSTLQGGKSNKKSLFSIKYAYEDTINLEKFLGNAKVSEGIEYGITYPKRYEAVVCEDYENQEIHDSNVISCKIKDMHFTVRSEAARTNVGGILLLGTWGITLILSLIGLLRNYKNLKRLSTIEIVCIVTFLFTSFRLIFRIF